MSLTQRTLSGGAWQFTAVVSRAFLQLLVIGILARYVTAAEFGLITIANMAMVFVSMFSQIGLGPALVQRKDLKVEHVRAAFWASVALGAMFLVIVWLSAPMIAAYFRTPAAVDVIRGVCISFLLSSLGLVAITLLERDLQFRYIFWVRLSAFICGYGLVGTIMAVLGYGVWAVVAAMVVQALVQSVVAILFHPHSILPRFSIRDLQDLIYFGGGLTLARFFNHIALQADYFIIGRQLGDTVLGLYERAFRIMELPGIYLGRVLDAVLFPAISIIQDQSQKVQEVYLWAISIVHIILMPLTVLFVVLSPEIVLVILGPNWTDTIVPLQIMFLGISLRTATQLSDALTRALGAVFRNAMRKIMYAASVILGAFIGKAWGIEGVAIGVTLAVCLHYLIMIQLGLNLISGTWRQFGRTLGHAAFLTVLMLILVPGTTYVLRSYFDKPFIVLMLTVLIIGGGSLAGIYRYPRLMGEAGNRLLVQIMPRLPIPEKIKARFREAYNQDPQV